MSEVNPGEKLRDLLMQKYPDTKADSFVQRMDRDFSGDGELSTIFYMSCINYAVRRLITVAAHYRRKYDPDLHGPIRHREELRKFLRDYTAYSRYGKTFFEELVSLLNQCLQESDRDASDGLKDKLRRKIREKGWRCYICGKSLNHDRGSTAQDAASIDHNWPRSMGGKSEEHNLGVACRECDNNLKQDFVDGSDYHYEEIAIGITSYDEYENRFKENQRRKAKLYETAVFAHSNFCCAGCGTPAFRLGELRIGRRALEDGWHFLNLTAYCASCSPEE